MYELYVLPNVSHVDCVFLETECRLCFLSSSDGWADVNLPVSADHNLIVFNL
jgi:hypothetical protein